MSLRKPAGELESIDLGALTQQYVDLILRGVL
jgi:hypothetical protein